MTKKAKPPDGERIGLLDHAPWRASSGSRWTKRCRFKYQSGELIHPGDRVLMHGEPGEVEFVADPADPSSDPEGVWHIESHGGGVMILEPKVFGRVFLQDTENAGDLVLVARAASKSIGD